LATKQSAHATELRHPIEIDGWSQSPGGSTVPQRPCVSTAAIIQRALDRLELRRFRDEQGRELLDVPCALAGSRNAGARPLLPKWDDVLLAFADRTRVLPEKYRRVVIGQYGDVAQTFLVDGLVAGTWRVDDGRVLAEPLEPPSATTLRELEEERLEALALVAD
jgi:hypothetical protein